jgi:hypothetical protein
MGDTSKMKGKKIDQEALLSTETVIKLGSFTPATSQNLQHPRANTDSQNSHNTQHTRAKQKFSLLYEKGHSA